jgi:nucleoid-associated protein YgaU
MHKLLTLTAVALAMAHAANAQSATDDEMRGLTSSILAGINGEKPAATEPEQTETDPTDTLSGLVQQALSEGQSDAYLEALIDEAVDNGQIEVTDGMRTTAGEVDTRMLLASLIAKSEGAVADVDTASLAAEAGVEPGEQVFHVVVSGDSLAAISLTYYGNPQDYTRIFDANRDTLERADFIRIGQSLLIPR